MSRIARDNPDRPEQWDAPRVFAPEPRRCLCSHAESLHYRDRQDRPTCGIAVCGCASFREDNR